MSNPNLRPQKGKAGYMDMHGNWVIKPIFDEANNFSEGLAKIKINDKYGYIDKTGKIVIEPKYQYARDFKGGFASVCKDEKWELIDTAGKAVEDTQSDDVEYLNEGLAAVKSDGCWGLIDTNGKVIKEPCFQDIREVSDGLVRVRMEGKYGYANKNGDIVIKPIYDNCSDQFSEGLAAVEINDKYGYINKEGNIAINPEFDFAGSFKDGLAPFKNDTKYGFIDKTGKIVIEPKFEDINEFNHGVCRVKINSQWEYIDREGKSLINPGSYKVDVMVKGLVKVWDSDDKAGVIDRQGNVLIKPQFSDLTILTDEVIIAGDENREGLFGTAGNWITPQNYLFGKLSEGLIAASIQGWGLVNDEGVWIVEPSYNYINRFYPIGRNGQKLALALKDGERVWLDGNGEERTDAVVPEDEASREGRMAVMASANGNEWFVDIFNEDNDSIDCYDAFTIDQLHIEIGGAQIDVDELNCIRGEDDLDIYELCESIDAAMAKLYYSQTAADTFEKVLVPEGEEFDSAKACLITQDWEMSEDDASMALSLVYDGVEYTLGPGESNPDDSIIVYE